MVTGLLIIPRLNSSHHRKWRGRTEGPKAERQEPISKIWGVYCGTACLPFSHRIHVTGILMYTSYDDLNDLIKEINHAWIGINIPEAKHPFQTMDPNGCFNWMIHNLYTCKMLETPQTSTISNDSVYSFGNPSCYSTWILQSGHVPVLNEVLTPVGL